MESAAYGCATITSNRGGLSETFNTNLILKTLDSSSLEKLIKKVILNKKMLKKIQNNNFQNVIHVIESFVSKIDSLKGNFLEKKIISIDIN